jgi:hypothetical protein
MSGKKLEHNGKSASRSGDGHWSGELLYPSEKLKDRLGEVFDFWRGSHKLHHRKEYRQDFVFHMTDWLNNLEELNALYKHPERYSKRKAAGLVYGFLIHVIPHLTAAGRILEDDIPDAFADLYHPQDQRVHHNEEPARPKKK